MRIASPIRAACAAGSGAMVSVSPFSDAATAWTAPTCRARSAGENAASSSVTLPASSREKSSTSLITDTSSRPLSRITASIARCSGSLSLRDNSSAMPSTPFSGVRISWLMVARKRDLASLAASAARRLSSSERVSCFASVMSMRRPTVSPFGARRVMLRSQRPPSRRCSKSLSPVACSASRSASHAASRPSASGYSPAASPWRITVSTVTPGRRIAAVSGFMSR